MGKDEKMKIIPRGMGEERVLSGTFGGEGGKSTNLPVKFQVWLNFFFFLEKSFWCQDI